MGTFSAVLAICAGNSPFPVNALHKGQWRGALMFSLICVWIYGWVNSREAGELRRYRAHYDVIVMKHGRKDQSKKSHNAPVPYLTIHQNWNRNAYISVPKWCIVGYGTDAFWDLRYSIIIWYFDVETKWLPFFADGMFKFIPVCNLM